MFGKQKSKTATVGSLGENIGKRYLERKGYRILAANYFNEKGYRLGEIDLVAEKDGMIVFVEVKTRIKKMGDERLLPESAITNEKLRRLERIAGAYLREKKRQSAEYRFDALAILYDDVEKTAKVRHLESIFL